MTQHAYLAPDTITVAAGRPPRNHDSPVNPPIVLSSTFHETAPPVGADRIYARMSNPTWDPFEEALAELEGAALPALTFASGLGAAAAALSLVPAISPGAARAAGCSDALRGRSAPSSSA